MHPYPDGRCPTCGAALWNTSKHFATCPDGHTKLVPRLPASTLRMAASELPKATWQNDCYIIDGTRYWQCDSRLRGAVKAWRPARGGRDGWELCFLKAIEPKSQKGK